MDGICRDRAVLALPDDMLAALEATDKYEVVDCTRALTEAFNGRSGAARIRPDAGHVAYADWLLQLDRLPDGAIKTSAFKAVAHAFSGVDLARFAHQTASVPQAYHFGQAIRRDKAQAFVERMLIDLKRNPDTPGEVTIVWAAQRIWGTFSVPMATAQANRDLIALAAALPDAPRATLNKALRSLVATDRLVELVVAAMGFSGRSECGAIMRGEYLPAGHLLNPLIDTVARRGRMPEMKALREALQVAWERVAAHHSDMAALRREGSVPMDIRLSLERGAMQLDIVINNRRR